MHELSLCRSIYDIVVRAAQGRTVTWIDVNVGKLRQVVPQTLVYCWDIVTEHGPLAGSKLRIAHIDVVFDCGDCGKETKVDGFPIFTCGHCASPNVTVLAGDEFLLTSIDVEGD